MLTPRFLLHGVPGSPRRFQERTAGRSYERRVRFQVGAGWIDRNVYRKPTRQLPSTTQFIEVNKENSFRADCHQEYLAKNPGGYCQDYSCGVSYLARRFGDLIGRHKPQSICHVPEVN
jgi:hypothetical protein